ncbi:MAG: PD-(D/E)XK nuclease family protein [Candidatus Thorarchaeota archaeon]
MQEMQLFPLSFADIHSYLRCPYSLLLKKQKAPKIETISPSQVRRGEIVHKIVAQYYQKLLENDVVYERRKEPFQVLMQIARTSEYEQYFRNFLKFEQKRAERGWRIVEVEQEHSSQFFTGVCDAVFCDEAGRRIVLDWKASSYFSTNYEMQGAIYKHIANAHTVIFLLLGSGREIFVNTESGERQLQNVVRRVLQGEFERRDDERVCRECEFSVFCLQQKYWNCFEEVMWK